ncbi:MAG: hemolysin family protein [Lachnospiraceae bacterium]|nr:hemolysin family protein [Lachnospiraceae bacterium]
MRFLRKEKTAVQEEEIQNEIKSMVDEGHEQGLFKESEAEMIKNIFTLDETEAQDIMTHRKHIVSVSAEMTFRDFLIYIKEEGFSRYPVYRDVPDNIIGVIHIKDVLSYVLRQDVMEVALADIRDLILPVPFVPEKRTIDILFRHMQSAKSHMVVVVDEYGQISGLITMEDILEEIVGNIFDEHDEEEKNILVQKDGSFLISGLAELKEVFETLGIEDESSLEDFDTLNGYIISRIDRIPSDEETFCVTGFGYRFDVLSVSDRMIQSVRVTKEDIMQEDL